MPVVCTFAKTTALYPKCMACMYMGILTHWSRTKTADILQMFSNSSCGVKSFMYVHILFHISLKCGPYGPVNYDKPALVQVMLYHRKGSAGDVELISFDKARFENTYQCFENPESVLRFFARNTSTNLLVVHEKFDPVWGKARFS